MSPPDLRSLTRVRLRSRRCRKTGHKALHLVSAFATNSRLVLGHRAVDEKSNEITAIPALGSGSTSRAPWSRSMPWNANPHIAQPILDTKADYLLAVKDNQPTLNADIESPFETAPPNEVERVETVGKDQGRFDVHNHTVSQVVDWYAAQRSYPGARDGSVLETAFASRMAEFGEVGESPYRRPVVEADGVPRKLASPSTRPICLRSRPEHGDDALFSFVPAVGFAVLLVSTEASQP